MPTHATRLSLSAIATALILSACAAPPPAAAPAAAPTAAPKAAEATAAPAAASGDMTALIAAAKAEGELNVIALPRDWCNYGEMIDSFKTKYGLKVNEINPDAGSAEELEAVKANKDNKGPQAPMAAHHASMPRCCFLR
jgi:putative spermidine/putrescine transport system substrate-binding protein